MSVLVKKKILRDIYRLPLCADLKELVMTFVSRAPPRRLYVLSDSWGLDVDDEEFEVFGVYWSWTQAVQKSWWINILQSRKPFEPSGQPEVEAAVDTRDATYHEFKQFLDDNGIVYTHDRAQVNHLLQQNRKVCWFNENDFSTKRMYFVMHFGEDEVYRCTIDIFDVTS